MFYIRTGPAGKAQAAGLLACGDGLDLDQLVLVAEHRDPQQRARRIVLAERAGYLVPGGNEVGPVGAGDEHGGLQHVCESAAALFERDPQIRERLASLLGGIPWRDDLPRRVKRASSRGKHEARCGW